MKFSTFLLIFILFGCSGYSQKNWKAFDVGGIGTKYKATQYSFGIRHERMGKKDTTIEKSITEFTRKIVDSDENALYAELEIKDHPDKPVYFKLNKQGGAPLNWNDKPGWWNYISKGKSVAWSFFDIPNIKLKKRASWKADVRNPFGEDTITLSFKVVGKIDTLGHECAIISVKEDILDEVLLAMKVPKEISGTDQFEGLVEIEYKFYVDKSSGLLIYGQTKSNVLISFKSPETPFFLKGIGTGTITLLSNDIPNEIKTITKLSPEEREEQELNAERNLPSVEYDFGEKLKVIFPMKFHEDFVYRNFYRGYSSVKIDDYWRLVDSTGTLVPDFFSDEEILHVNDYFTFSPEEVEGVGLKTLKGDVFLEPKYESIRPRKSGTFFVVNGARSTLLNEQGEEILPNDNYDISVTFSNNCAITTDSRRKGRVGAYFDPKVSLPKGYLMNRSIESDFVLGKKDSKRYLFDCSGNLISEDPIETFEILSDRFFGVQFLGLEKTTVYERINGEVIEKLSLPTIDFGGYNNNASFYAFSENGKIGLFDSEFNVYVPPGDYKEFDCNAEGCFFKYPNGTYGYFTPEKGMVPLKSNDSLYMDRGVPFLFNSEKMIPVSINGIPIFEDEKGVEYQPVYDLEAGTWMRDIFIKKKVGSEGNQILVNSKGETLSSTNYYLIGYRRMQSDYINVYNENDKVGLLDLKGKEIIPPQFDKIQPVRHEVDDLFVVKKDKKYGLLDDNGEVIIPFEFDWITLNKHGMIWVKKDKKYGLLQYLK